MSELAGYEEIKARHLGNGHAGDAKSDWQPEPPDPADCSIAAWLSRNIPEADLLLGPFSTTSRGLMAADTGLGKTSFCMALAAAMAEGLGAFHWLARRPARVLYIEGEMSRRLVKSRASDTARRLGRIPSTLYLLSGDDCELPPLNSEAGQRFIDRFIDRLGGIDFAFFDNVQSLLPGDMKEEEPWQQTLPWIGTLTRRSIGQLWVHHTGHNTSRAYGTKTREWRMDMVLVGEAIDRPGTDIAFSLKFDKARERGPHNREDFASVVITLQNDAWNVERSAEVNRGKSPSPSAQRFHGALLDAIMSSVQSIHGRPAATRNQWQGECVRLGLLDRGDDRTNATSRALLSKYRRQLIEAEWIACDGDFVWSIRQHN
jgi:AAA domain